MHYEFELYEYARIEKTEDEFPLWEVQLRQNWNLGDTIKQEGEFKKIRLFHKKSSAELFVVGINVLLRMIIDVPE